MARAPSAVHRNRVIYQSEALFVSPDATGYHFTGKNGYGLMTPALHGNQEAGEVKDNKLYGWTKADGLANWPDWNADESAEASDPVAGVQADTDDAAGGTIDITLAGAPGGTVNDTTVRFVTANGTAAVNGATVRPDTHLTFGQLAGVLSAGFRQGTVLNVSNAPTVSTFEIAFDANNGPIGGMPGSHAADPTMTGYFANFEIQVDITSTGGTETATITSFDGTAGTVTLSSALTVAPAAGDVIRIYYPGFDADTLALTGAITFDATFAQVPAVPEIGASTGGSDMIFTNSAITGPTSGYQFQFTDATAPGYLDVATANAAVSISTPSLADVQAAFPDVTPDANNGYSVFDLARYFGFTILSTTGAPGGTQAQIDAFAATEFIDGTGGEDIKASTNGFNDGVAGTAAIAASDGESVQSNGTDTLTFAGGVTGVPSYDAPGKAHGSIIKQLKRVQTLNYGFTINRTDINQFGHLARLDSVVLENPNVNLDFSYFLLDGYNERMLEFVTNGYDNCLSGHLNPEYYQAGNNFFVVTVPEARDVVVGDVSLQKEGFDTRKSVISVGNGFITDYSIDLAVGAIPTASITVEGMNIKSDLGTTGLNLPSVDLYDGSLMSDAFEYDPDNGSVTAVKDNSCTGLFSLPPAESGYNGCPDPSIPMDEQENVVAALRPGDVVLNLSEKGLMSVQSSGDYKDAKAQKGAAHLQSATLSVGMGRTNLQRLGSTFSFSKAIDVPINATLSVSAVMSDIKQGNVVDLICNCEELDIEMDLYEPACVGCDSKEQRPTMKYAIKGAQLVSETFSSTVGDNKTVDLEFTVQIGGADDLSKGVFISGREGNPKISDPNIDGGRTGGADAWGLPPGFTGQNGEYNVPTSSDDLPRKLRRDDRDASTEIDGTYDVLGYRS